MNIPEAMHDEREYRDLYLLDFLALYLRPLLCNDLL